MYTYSIPTLYGQQKTSFPNHLSHYRIASSEKPIPFPSVDSADYLVRFSSSAKLGNYRILKAFAGSYAIVRLEDPFQHSGDFQEIEPANAMWKASDRLVGNWQSTSPDELIRVQLVLRQPSKKTIDLLKASTPFIIEANATYPVISLPARALPALLAQADVLFAEEIRQPIEEFALNNWAPGINQINRAQAAYPDITGLGVKVAVKEQRYDEKDLDLLNRSFSSGPVSTSVSTHASIMATTIGGNGNSSVQGKGVAPEVTFTSADFANLLPDDLQYLTGKGVTIENHSYGVGIENYYGIEALEYDRQLHDTDTLVHVFSSGNAGSTTPTDGLYAGVPNRANLTGTFKQAKNVLIVGGINAYYQPEERSSCGPAYDGRIKPELVASGEDGTSGASATTSGIVALLQQSLRQQTGRTPSSAMVKAILINSADDLANPHLDYKTGFGKVNAYRALQTVQEARYWQDKAAQGEVKSFSVKVNESAAELKITLVWNDTPAAIQAPKALVNDLNLQVLDPQGNRYLPWVLSPLPEKLDQPAIRGVDSLNNVEQISLAFPLAGTYTVLVENHRANGLQAFALSYQIRTKEVFEWETPTPNESLFAGTEQVIRWNSTLEQASGRLSWSIDDGQHWQVLSDSINLAASFYSWETPSSFTKALLKMEAGDKAFISPPFSLSTPLSLHVGYQCPDEWLLYWAPQPRATGYALYALQNSLLTPYQIVKDTLVKLSVHPSMPTYFAVAALAETMLDGIRSPTIDVSSQGVDCYVRNLLAEAEPNKVRLRLLLGTTNGLAQVTWQRLVYGQYLNLGTTAVANNQLQYDFEDIHPPEGILQYRALLHTISGIQLETAPVSVAFILPDRFLLMPNPVDEELLLLSSTLGSYELRLFDLLGRLVMVMPVENLEQRIPVGNLPPGIYLCQLLQDGQPLFRAKIVKR